MIDPMNKSSAEWITSGKQKHYNLSRQKKEHEIQGVIKKLVKETFNQSTRVNIWYGKIFIISKMYNWNNKLEKLPESYQDSISNNMNNRKITVNFLLEENNNDNFRNRRVRQASISNMSNCLLLENLEHMGLLL